MKSSLVEQIRNGEITPEGAVAKHGVSLEELAAWRATVDKFGTRALRATKLQNYTGRKFRGDKRLRPSMRW